MTEKIRHLTIFKFFYSIFQQYKLSTETGIFDTLVSFNDLKKPGVKKWTFYLYYYPVLRTPKTLPIYSIMYTEYIMTDHELFMSCMTVIIIILKIQ